MADDNGWRKLAEKVVPGLVPERTRSGVRIDVNSSGTTSVADHGALVKIALERFAEMREPSAEPRKSATQR